MYVESLSCLCASLCASGAEREHGDTRLRGHDYSDKMTALAPVDELTRPNAALEKLCGGYYTKASRGSGGAYVGLACPTPCLPGVH